MRIHGSHVVITGAATGLGAALAERAAARGAARLDLIDLDAAGLARTAAPLAASTFIADLTNPVSTHGAIKAITAKHVPSLVIANAGTISTSDLSADDSAWDLSWRLHVMSNVWLFEHLMPLMHQRGSGHLACTASAASFAPNPKSVVYSVTKQAQFGLAEWVASACRNHGLGFTCFCPGGMRTPMLARMASDDPYSLRALDEAQDPADAADAFLDGIEADRFLVVTKERTQRAARLLAEDPEGLIEEAARSFSRPVSGGYPNEDSCI